MATRSVIAFYAPYLRASWAAAKTRRTRAMRHASKTARPSGILWSTGLVENASSEATPGGTALEPSALRAVPLELQSLQTSEAAKQASSIAPFEILHSVELNDPFAASLFAKTTSHEDHFPAMPRPLELARIEETVMQEISAALDSHVEEQTAAENAWLARRSGAGSSITEAMTTTTSARLAFPEPEYSAARDLLSFFGLRQPPFDVTPDPTYLYLSPSHRAALASLKQGVEFFRGFMTLVAEPGMGKTTLLNRLMEELTDSARVVFLFQTQCTSRELLCYILNELEVDHTGMDVVAMHRALNQALLEEMLRGRRFVLVVDEAQNLEEPVLETIRLLSDFETTHSKLIQIILAGQPQLADKLMKPGLVQLRQRIAVLANLKSLNAEEIAEYIEHRLRVSGWSGAEIFTSAAIAQIAESSGGVPRSINNLCFSALLEAYQRCEETIGADIVKHVAGRLNLESFAAVPLEAETKSLSEGPAAAATANVVNQLARALAAAISAEARPESKAPEAFIGPQPKPNAVIIGTVTEKIRTQGWSKKPEYRVFVTFERDPLSGLPVTDRYYSCSMYLDETQAATLQTGKPLRIKFEQD
jgi:general secretion pathway protein A